MNKREALLGLADGTNLPDYVPAGFFLHFDPVYHQGQEAINKHLDFFRATGMDFVKIQYEQNLPPTDPIRKAEEWANAPRHTEEFFEPTLRVVKGLVQAAGNDALIIMTLYSPLMWAVNQATGSNLADQLKENPAAVQKGLEIMTDNVLTLVRGCMKAGVDGFYASSQGGETFRFPGTDFFKKYVKPTDLAVWAEIESCVFNILHVCDYQGGYTDLTPFLDYPGHVVNCSLKLGDRTMSPKEVSEMFRRPFMGGMERTGVIAKGTHDEIRHAAEKILDEAPERFILGADCTVPGETPWTNLKTAIDTAHDYRK